MATFDLYCLHLTRCQLAQFHELIINSS